MRIAVCMKQVPARSQGDMDPETGVIRRSVLQTMVNRYDLSALEAALRWKEAEPDSRVDVFTMGPAKAEEVLRMAFAMGADCGYLITDHAFGGADVLATSYTLSQAIRAVGNYDLILCGRQTTDGDTAQVSGALAQWLDIPHLNWVERFKRCDLTTLITEVHTECERMEITIPMPCLISVESAQYQPRMPSLRLKIAAKKKPICVLGRHQLADSNVEHYGFKGSATKVKKIYPPKPVEHQPVFEGGAEQAAQYILDHWRECQ